MLEVFRVINDSIIIFSELLKASYRTALIRSKRARDRDDDDDDDNEEKKQKGITLQLLLTLLPYLIRGTLVQAPAPVAAAPAQNPLAALAPLIG